MGLENYYHIIDEKVEATSAVFLLELNANHPMYKGHFPEYPLLPGVVQVQLIQTLLEKSLRKNLSIISSKNIKFLGMINPNENTRIQVVLDWKQDEEISLQAKILSVMDIPIPMMKFTAKYKMEV